MDRGPPSHNAAPVVRVQAIILAALGGTQEKGSPESRPQAALLLPEA
jgi:hypothetical protein